MPGRGMADMIQLISVLNDMQSRRRDLDLRREQFETQKVQFARQAGLSEKDERFKELGKLIDTYVGATTESRASAEGMASSLGFDPEMKQAFLGLINGAPTSAQNQIESSVERGYASMNPQQQTQLNQETASSRMSGMNQGQMATSGLTRDVAQGAQQMFGQQQQAELLSKKPGAATQAMQGIMPGWGNFQQADVARGQVAANYYGTNAQMISDAQKQAAQLASFKAMGMLTADQRVSGYNTMLQVLKEMRAKGGNDASRLTDLALFNRIAASVDPTMIISNPDQAPDEASLLDRMKNFVSPPGLPGQAPAVQPPMYQNWNPAARTQQSWNFQGQGQNPITPFLQQP